MAVTRTQGTSRLQLRYHIGEDDEGQPIFRLRSYSNVRADANDEDLLDVGEALAGLQEHLLQDVFRHDSAALVRQEG